MSFLSRGGGYKNNRNYPPAFERAECTLLHQRLRSVVVARSHCRSTAAPFFLPDKSTKTLAHVRAESENESYCPCFVRSGMAAACKYRSKCGRARTLINLKSEERQRRRAARRTATRRAPSGLLQVLRRKAASRWLR